MPKSEREETLAALTALIFSAMLDELVMDATLQSHHEVARGNALCKVCNTRCGSIHTPGATDSQSSASGLAATSSADTPSSASSTDPAKTLPNGSFGTGTSTPTTSGKADGNLFLECVSCNRQIASNRYALHLSSCMGLSTARRGAVRGGAKSKQASDAGRSASPASEAENGSDEKVNGNGKGKAKGKGKKAEESDFTNKRKRPGSPQVTPNKKSKKGKPAGSPVSRVKADPDPSGLPTNSHYSPSTTSQSKVPSKLRDSSTASFLDHSQSHSQSQSQSQSPSSSASSRDSSPEGDADGGSRSAATPASSSFSKSPTGPRHGQGQVAGNGNGNGRAGGGEKSGRGRPVVGNANAKGRGPPKRPSPPRPQPIHVPDYAMDIDHGNETGSSTDTDSD
ncbi:hypothetical protein B0H34DRAFT_855071 [Crassisporium funariophilum]|nr:hypothetical protein B0H34DRAFT_855071 [Crassisporium funariophilum]